MRQIPQLAAYCMEWHVRQSEAFKDLLIRPLAPYANLTLTPWDGENLSPPQRSNEPLIFCMLPPPPQILAEDSRHLVWIPMWDQAQGYDEAWWRRLPKNLRVVAFSKAIFERATAARLETLGLRYYLDPDSTTSAGWQDGRILFYWNRVGLISPDFLTSLCKSLDIRTLLFKPDIDPRIASSQYYELPDKLGKTDVVNIKTTSQRKRFLDTIKSANIVISPRLTEGVGLITLEAMSKGCAVIAHDGPTMNEYISHSKNGVLLQKDAAHLKGRWWQRPRREAQQTTPYLLSDYQPWERLAKLPYEQLGHRAREDSRAGFNKWQAAVKDYASFVLEW